MRPSSTRIVLISLLVIFNIAAVGIVSAFLVAASLAGAFCELLGPIPADQCVWRAIVVNSMENTVFIAVFFTVLIAVNLIIGRFLIATRKPKDAIRT
jgi:hypothetical protein